MRAILPRRQVCVMCDNPIEGPGRIDRLYCAAKCRNLAWRFRAGKRAGKPTASVPVEAARRRVGLLRQAWGLQGEVAATRRRIGDLQVERAQAQARAKTDRQRLDEAGVALDQERAAWNAERASLQAKLAAAHEQAARNEVTLQELNTAHTTLLKDQAAWARERTSTQAELAAVRKHADAQETKLQEEVQRLVRRNRDLDQRLLDAELAKGQAEDLLAEAEFIQKAQEDRQAELQRPRSQSMNQGQPSDTRTPAANEVAKQALPPAAQTPPSTASPPPSDASTPPDAATGKPPPQQEQPRPLSWVEKLRRKLAEPPSRKGRHLLD